MNNVARYKWPSRFGSADENVNDYREHYKYGDLILGWHTQAEQMQSLSVPRSFGGSRCIVNTPIKHLKNERIKCVQSMDEHNNFIAELEQTLRLTKILMHRKPLNTSPKVLADLCRTPANANETLRCVDIGIYYCTDAIDSQSCKMDNRTDTETADNCIVDELALHFHHNFTNVLNVSVYFVCHELALDAASVLQMVNIEYFEANETHTTKNAHQISGNIGYVQHRPILMTKYVTRQGPSDAANATPADQMLAYFEKNANCSGNEHILKMPAIRPNGDCIRDNKTFNAINFDENIRFTCNVVIAPELNDSASLAQLNATETETDSYENYTNVCRAFQLVIFQYLLYDLEQQNPNATSFDKLNALISELGNPKNDATHWIPLETVNAPSIEQIVADKNSNGFEFTCRNMVLSIRYSFYYGRIMINDNANQAVIRATQLEYGPRLDLNFKMVEKNLKVPIYVDVMFHDYIKLTSNDAISLKTLAIPFSIGFYLLSASVANSSSMLW